MYATPWCWIDGKDAGYDYPGWESFVADELAQTTDILINLNGGYDPGSRTGTITAEFVSSSASDITANAYFVVTEDSVNYTGGNGDPWHNHVCRDYIPDENGTALTVAAGGRETLTQSFVLDGGWNEPKCNIVVYLQEPGIQPDSSKITYQAATARVVDWTGVAEGKATARSPGFKVGPSPGKGLLHIQGLRPLKGILPEIRVQDASGRTLRSGRPTGDGGLDLGSFADGIYFISIAGAPETSQKVVIQR